MILCPSCNTENPDGAKFCRNCGTKLETAEAMPEPHIDTFPGGPEEPSPSYTLPGIPEEPEKKKSGAAKWILIAIIAILIAAIALLAPKLFKSSGKLHNYGTYIKDQELWYTDLSKKAPSQITNRLFGGEELDGEELSYIAEDGLDAFVVASGDGRTIFYPDKIDFDSDGLTMYFRPLSGKDTEPVKIDSGITGYWLNDDYTLFTYLKNSSLYQYDLKTRDKQKLASDVYDYEISTDGKTIVYLSDESDLYRQEIGKDREKLGTDVDYLENVSEDFTTVWFSADDCLYKKEAGKDVEKVLENVPSSGIEMVYDSGEVFYFVASEEEKMLIDYVNDDLKDIDDRIEEPVEPEYPEDPVFPERPYREDFASEEEYEAAAEKYLEEYDAIEAAYYEELTKYLDEYEKYEDLYYDYIDKLDRDKLREDLAQTFAPSTYEYYYFDGESSVLLCGNYDTWSAKYATGKAASVFTAFDESNFGKLDITDIYSVYDVEDMINSAMYNAEGTLMLACGASVSELPDAEPYYMTLASDASLIYYFDVEDYDSMSADLYRLTVTDGKPGEAELYAEDAYTGNVILTEEGELIHFRDADSYEGFGDLYVGKELAGSDVDLYRLRYDARSKTLLYLSDYDYDRQYGTLNVFNNGKKEKIADDVHSCCVTFGGDILYLSDYSMKRYEGDLYVYRKGSSTKIDSEVTAIIPPYDGASGFLY